MGNASIVLGSSPQLDPLVEAMFRLRQWFGEPWVQAKYAYQGTSIPTVHFGWKSREEQLNTDPAGANRICLMPGWGAKGKDLGSFVAPIRTSARPRTLATQNYKFTISVWSVDNADAQDEALQANAASILAQAAWQGLYNGASSDPDNPTVLTGNLLPNGKNYRDEYSVNLSYGWEVLIEATILARVYDFALDQSVGVTPTVIKENPPWPPPSSS
jgi:hypothetical protein